MIILHDATYINILRTIAITGSLFLFGLGYVTCSSNSKFESKEKYDDDMSRTETNTDTPTLTNFESKKGENNYFGVGLGLSENKIVNHGENPSLDNVWTTQGSDCEGAEAIVESLDDKVDYDEYDEYVEDYDNLHSQYRPKQLPHCDADRPTLEKSKRDSMVIVSTLDGQITGMDLRSGTVLWTVKTGVRFSPMLSSSMSRLEITSRGEWVRLIPSLDGGIYRFNGEDVEALPITADTLLHSSFKFNDDTIFSGGKSTEVWGLEPETGTVAYVCNDEGCRKPRQVVGEYNNILVVKRITHTVRAIDPKTGNERWNFSVGDHEMNLLSGGGCDSILDPPLVNLPDLHFVIPEGRVCGLEDQSRLLMWEQKLQSPIVNAWRVISGQLEKLDLFSISNIPALSPNSEYSEESDESSGGSNEASMYVGLHHDQLYIQHNTNIKAKIKSISELYSTNDQNSKDVSFPKVQWRPYLASAKSRTPVIHFGSSKNRPLLDYDRNSEKTDMTVKQDLEYPFDDGYYLYGSSDELLNNSDVWDYIDDEENEYDVFGNDSILDDVTDHIYRICFIIGPETWWIMASIILLFGATYIFAIRLFRQRTTQQATLMLQMFVQGILHNNPNIMAMMQRFGLQIVPIHDHPQPPPPHSPIRMLPPALPQLIMPTTPIKSSVQQSSSNINTSSSVPSTDRQDSTSSQFSSRYHSDFEPIQCLGRGGFGVVFHVKNKLDENEYAVKRIMLPSKESSAERVKREVRALAKLNHNNIVRYYNSWLETPPFGWQDELDSWWKNTDSFSMSVYSPDVEETEEQSMMKKLTNQLTKKNESLSDILNKEIPLVNNPNSVEEKQDNVTDDEDDGYNDDDNSGYDEDDDESSENDESFDDNDYSHGNDCLVSGGETDSSFDIVFQAQSEDSFSLGAGTRSNLNKCSKEDSLDVVFQHSDNISQSIGDESCDIKSRNVKSINKCNVTFNESSCKSTQNKVLHNSNYALRKGGSTSSLSDLRQKAKNKRKRAKSQCIPQTRERPSTLSLYSHSDPPEALSLFDRSKVDTITVPRTFMYIQMELCKKESLKDWLFNNQSRDAITILGIFNNIVHAVEYVHDHQMMHRDLKPSNIFFSLDDEVKVGDFGLVTSIAEVDLAVLTPSGGPHLNQTPHQRTHQAGTQLYMSPEQINCKPYDYKVDIFSLGLIYFEMLVPFSTEMERRMVMSQARNRIFPPGFMEQYPEEYEVLKLMLCNTPTERPTTRGIRARRPLSQLQGDSINLISIGEHFKLSKNKTHARSHSGSFIFPPTVS